MTNQGLYQSIITMEPGKRGGQPCIRNLRITVYDVMEYLAAGMTELEILEDFPELTADDLQACLRFAADQEHGLDSVALHRQWQDKLDIDRFFDEVFGPGSRVVFQE